MNCKEARATAIEQVRLGAAVIDPHFKECAECARFLEAQLAFQPAFATLQRDVSAPANLEANLLAEFDGVRARAPRRFPWPLPAVAALAASLVVGTVLIHRQVAPPRASGGPFVEIPYIAPLAPYERTKIVRMDIPAAALIAAGFDVTAPDTGAALRADVLFGQDGRAHAIRLVSNSIPNSN